MGYRGIWGTGVHGRPLATAVGCLATNADCFAQSGVRGSLNGVHGSLNGVFVQGCCVLCVLFKQYVFKQPEAAGRERTHMNSASTLYQLCSKSAPTFAQK
eukprot:13942041-Heterocapsa_arctica.AAC.1